MSAARFHGVFPYDVSPVSKTGEVDAGVLARLCDDLVKAGVHGLTPLGSTGEYACLTRAQRRRVVEVVIEAAKGCVPVVADVASTTIADAVSQAREFERLGCGGMLAILEAYFPRLRRGRIRLLQGDRRCALHSDRALHESELPALGPETARH